MKLLIAKSPKVIIKHIRLCSLRANILLTSSPHPLDFSPPFNTFSHPLERIAQPIIFNILKYIFCYYRSLASIIHFLIIMPKISSYTKTRIKLHNQGLLAGGILKSLKSEGLLVTRSCIPDLSWHLL